MSYIKLTCIFEIVDIHDNRHTIKLPSNNTLHDIELFHCLQRHTIALPLFGAFCVLTELVINLKTALGKIEMFSVKHHDHDICSECIPCHWSLSTLVFTHFKLCHGPFMNTPSDQVKHFDVLATGDHYFICGLSSVWYHVVLFANTALLLTRPPNNIGTLFYQNTIIYFTNIFKRVICKIFFSGIDVLKLFQEL